MKFLEAWRVAKNLDSFYLVGHSLGGYISSLYTIKYPQRVKKLLLVSPIGFHQKPDDFNIRRIEV
jgi:cardiolipin-specific phospholipase